MSNETMSADQEKEIILANIAADRVNLATAIQAGEINTNPYFLSRNAIRREIKNLNDLGFSDEAKRLQEEVSAQFGDHLTVKKRG